MNADDDVRTPALEEVAHVTDSLLVEEFSGLRTKAVDGPVEILHPVLLATQQPVVEPDHFRCDFVRLFDGAHDTHGVGPVIEEFLDASDNSRRSGAMASTC